MLEVAANVHAEGDASGPLRRSGLSRLSVAIAAAACAIGVSAPPPAVAQVAQVRHFQVTRFKSITFNSPLPFATAIAGNTEIADVLPMSDRVLYIQGKRVGTTNITLYDQDKRFVSVIDLDVTIDLGDIKTRIASGTESRGIRVSSIKNQIVLSGEARNAVDAERAVSIAKAMVTTDDGREVDPGSADKYVVNAMRVAPSQQVMLRVRFVEVDRSAERSLGVNWFAANKAQTAGLNSGNGSVTLPSSGTTTQTNGFSFNTTSGTNGTLGSSNTTSVISQAVPVFQTLGTLASGSSPFGVGLLKFANIDVLISALETKGLARKLAEPDLVALSGDTASFLAGGEYPVPSIQSSSGTAPVVTTTYEPYGVQLTFVPTVLANGLINLRLNPSVSELDYANAVTISGTSVPSITKRETRTTIELRDGQSFAIAGLLQSDNSHDVNQVPWLGSVPVLGLLFSSKSYQAAETDLVVIVTPHLVAPAAPGQKLATPFDKSMPPNDVDFFLMGKPDVRKRYNDYITSGGGNAGPYGDIMPLSTK